MLINFNHLKTFYNALVHKMKSFRGNWEQNDSSAEDYIKNRPFYTEAEEIYLVDKLTSADYFDGHYPACTFVVGQRYNILWNDTLYKNLECYEDDGWRIIGGNSGPDGKTYPFYIDDDGGNNLYIESDENFIVSIMIPEVIHRIDKKYLPEDIGVPEGVITEESLPAILEETLPAVQYTTQELSDEQRAIARENIGTLAEEDVITTGESKTVTIDWNGYLTNWSLKFNSKIYYKVADEFVNFKDITSFTSLNTYGSTDQTNYNGYNCYRLGYSIVVTVPGECQLRPSADSQELLSFSAGSAGVYFYYDQYSSNRAKSLSYTYSDHILSENISGVVRYAPQELSGEQQAQARMNIGAFGEEAHVNFWEANSDETKFIPGVIRQSALPYGYPYVTYEVGEVVYNGYWSGTLTVTKNYNGSLKVTLSSHSTGGASWITAGEKYLIVIGDKAYTATGVGQYDRNKNVSIDGIDSYLFTNTEGTIQIYAHCLSYLNLSEGTFEWGLYHAIPTYSPISADYIPDTIARVADIKNELPEITANDAGKVLTANADGTAGWKESQGGTGGGGGTEILTFDSVEEMNASNAPEGSIAIVPSTGGGGGSGLPTVTLTTVPTAEMVDLTAEESAAMDAVAAFGETYGTPIILNCSMPYDGDLLSMSMVANRFGNGMYYVANSMFGIVMLATMGSGWFSYFVEDSTATSSTEAQAVI